MTTEEYKKQRQEQLHKELGVQFPKAGDKIKAMMKFPTWFYPHFRDMVEDGYKSIRPGEEYTVRKCEVYSSWCAVWLEELPDTEERPDRYFNRHFFEDQEEPKSEQTAEELIISCALVEVGLGELGRLISFSKTAYYEKHPNNEVYFNANIFTENNGKIWYGDLDLTLDSNKLQSLANKIQQYLYILGEHDGRFENEKINFGEIQKRAVCVIIPDEI